MMRRFSLWFAMLSLIGCRALAAEAPAEAQGAVPANAWLLPSSDEPLLEKLSLPGAAASLDRIALTWIHERKCGSCHTGWPYLMSRAVLKDAPSPALAEIRQFFEGRIANWDEDEKIKPHAHREIVGTAAALALHDAQTPGRLQPSPGRLSTACGRCNGRMARGTGPSAVGYWGRTATND